MLSDVIEITFYVHQILQAMAAASLFLAAKVEEQPRKLEHVIKMLHKCLNQDTLETNTDVCSLQKHSNETAGWGSVL